MAEDPGLIECFHWRTNERIREASEGVQALARKYGAEFLDLNKDLCDAAGNLKAEYTIEGMHLYANGYRPVMDALLPLLRKSEKNREESNDRSLWCCSGADPLMFLYLIIGYVLYRTGLITQEGSKALAHLLLYCVLPCVVLNHSVLSIRKGSCGIGCQHCGRCRGAAALHGGVVALFRKDPMAQIGVAFPTPGSWDFRWSQQCWVEKLCSTQQALWPC